MLFPGLVLNVVKMQLPIVRYDRLMAGDEQELEVLSRASRDFGFFRLEDVPELQESLLTETLKAIEDFFALPVDIKMGVKRTDANPFGYNDAELTKQRKDWKEIFDIGPERCEGDSETGTNQWPENDKLPNFKKQMQSYFEICSVVSKELLRKLAVGLGADQSTSDSVVATYAQHTSYLRLNHYPVCDSAAPENTPTNFKKEEWGDLAVGRHTDAGGVTILLMDGVRGLQMERNDVWTTIDFKRHDLIINIGDMIQVLSNDIYIAPQHRVIASATQERFSAPFFLNPSWESVITPLPCCIDKDKKKANYRPLPWKEFRSLRALGDYKDAGEEVQIAHYKYDTVA